MLQQAVVLVGGLGSRLGELTKNTPKPMLPINGVCFLDILLSNLARHGFNNVLLLAQYKSEVIRAHYSNIRIKNLQIQIVEEKVPKGTGGALLEAAHLLDDVFLLVNGDTYFDINYLALLENFDSSTLDLSLALCEVENAARYGKVQLDPDGSIKSFAEKSSVSGVSGFISAGIYIVSRRIINNIQPGFVSLENDIIPDLVERKRVMGRVFDGFFIDIGLPSSYQKAQKELDVQQVRPAIFLDRDGTINFDAGYTHKTEDLKFLPGVPEAIRAFNDAGYLVIVISNQSGIARGYFDHEQVHNFNREINRRIQNYGAHIDAFYFCPHHPEGSVAWLKQICECRKPGTALFSQACLEWNIDLDQSVMIGDKDIDLAAAKKIGIDGILTDGSDMAKLATQILH